MLKPRSVDEDRVRVHAAHAPHTSAQLAGAYRQERAQAGPGDGEGAEGALEREADRHERSCLRTRALGPASSPNPAVLEHAPAPSKVIKTLDEAKEQRTHGDLSSPA
eukprot:1148314-Pelagomonas_calceolata.AAC.2